MAIFIGVLCFIVGMCVGALLLACIALSVALGKKEGDENDWE